MDKIINGKTGKMIRIPNDCAILEGITCTGFTVERDIFVIGVYIFIGVKYGLREFKKLIFNQENKTSIHLIITNQT
ncbi:MAG: hypothetical protein ACREOW_12885 [Thermodesulfobacteriota bacterium]